MAGMPWNNFGDPERKSVKKELDTVSHESDKFRSFGKRRGGRMLSYKNHLRMSVLMAHGKVDPSMLSDDPTVTTPIDAAIISLAESCLNKSDKTAFFFAYHCSPSWEEIQLIFSEKFNRELQLATVQTYGERAATTIIERAANASMVKDFMTVKTEK